LPVGFASVEARSSYRRDGPQSLAIRADIDLIVLVDINPDPVHSIDGISDRVIRNILVGAADGEHLFRFVHQPPTIGACAKIACLLG
jgi:hypothetical protein